MVFPALRYRIQKKTSSLEIRKKLPPKICDPDCLVQPPNSRIAPKSIGEGASSLFGGWPGSPENVSCSRATPRLHRCKSGVALEKETFSGLPGHPPKRLLAPSPIEFRGNPGIRGLYQAVRVATQNPHPKLGPNNWRQIWRVAGRESGSPELLGCPQTSPEFPELPRKFFGDFPGSSLTVELHSNPEVPRKFPRLPPLWEAWRPLLTHKNSLWNNTKNTETLRKRSFSPLSWFFRVCVCVFFFYFGAQPGMGDFVFFSQLFIFAGLRGFLYSVPPQRDHPKPCKILSFSMRLLWAFYRVSKIIVKIIRKKQFSVCVSAMVRGYVQHF